MNDLFVTGSSDEVVCLWNGNLELIATYDAFAPVRLLKFSADGQKIMAGTSVNNSVLVWNVEQQPPSLDLVHVIKGHSRKITGLAFLGDGNTVVSVSDDGTSKTWDLAKPEPSVRLGKVPMRPPTWAEPARLTYAGDGKGLWITDPDGERYGLNFDSHDFVAPPDPKGFHTLAVSRDGEWQAGATDDGHLAVRNARQGVLRAKHPSLAAEMKSVVVFSVGPTVAWRAAGIVHIWNVNDNTTRTFGIAIAGLPDVSPRGDRVAVYRWDTTSVWDISVDPPVVLWRKTGWGPEFCTVFSPRGDLVASASYNSQIRLFAAGTGDLVRTLRGHTDAVQSVKFSRDGSWLVSGGKDRTVRIWDVETGQLLSTFVNYDGPVCSVALSPTEDSIASLTDDGVLRLWRAATPEEVYQHDERWIQRADIYSGLQRWDQALALLDEGLKHNPVSKELLLTRSELHEHKGDWAAAISDITRAIALAPEDGTLLKQQADLLLQTGQRPAAIASYAKAITQDADLRSDLALKQIQLFLSSALVPTGAEWRYTTTDPGENWQDPDHFDDSQWQLGRAPFGSISGDGGPDYVTRWGQSDRDIWLRHTFTADEADNAPLFFRAYVDDEVQIYLNGTLTAEAAYLGSRYQILQGSEGAALRSGRNVLALHAHNREDVAKIDVNLHQQAHKRDFEDVLSQALKKSPSDPHFLRGMGRLCASEYRWSEAATYFRRLLDGNPEDEEDWMRTAALLTAAGELDDYHRLCTAMLERFQAPGAQEIAERIAKACLIIPLAESDLQAAVELARKSAADTNHWVMPYAMMTRALADYRSGDFAGARNWAQRSLKSPPTWFVDAEAHLVLAMSEFQLNETEAARNSLTRAQSVLSAQAKNYRVGTLGENWHDWLYSPALLHEAATLIDGRRNNP